MNLEEARLVMDYAPFCKKAIYDDVDDEDILELNYYEL